ncbi:MAG: SEC-C metal-binding domain-containing protein, partial [Acidobacteriota bacterium]
LMQRLGMEEGVPIEHKMVTNAIARAQKQVEAQNFSVRKHLLEYDDVMNKQRESIYALRRELLEGRIHITDEESVESREYLLTLAEELLDSVVDRYTGDAVDPEERDLDGLKQAVGEIYGIDPEELGIDLEGMRPEEITDSLWGPILEKYEKKEALIPTEILRRVERDIMLQIVDVQWKDHLYSLDHLKEGIGLRGYGQRDPLVEYKKESFALFTAMKDRVEEEIVRYLWRLTPVVNDDAEGGAPAAPIRPVAPRRPPSQITLSSPATAPPPSPFGAVGGSARAPQQAPRPARTGGDDVIRQVKRDEPKTGRNDPCPCGSGKKFKKCHGA